MNGYTMLLMVVATVLAASHARAAEMRLSVGVDYSTGDYGEPEDTDITYIPVTGRYQTEKWIARLTIPYIRITGPSTVLPEIGPVGTAPTPRRTEEGLGDILFSLSREIYTSETFLLDLTGRMKLATADEDQGLGTGENDYSLQFDGFSPVDRATLFGTIGYRILGDPPDFELDNVLFGSLGFSYPVSERLSSGAILDLRQETSPAGDPRQEVMVFANNKLTPDWNAQGYLVRGLSDGSPDWAVGLVLVYRGPLVAPTRRSGQ